MEVIEHRNMLWAERAAMHFWTEWLAAGGDAECRFAVLTFPA